MTSGEKPKRSLRKRIVSSLKTGKTSQDAAATEPAENLLTSSITGGSAHHHFDDENNSGREQRTSSHRREEDAGESDSSSSARNNKTKRRGEGFVGRMRSLSRSRSRSKSASSDKDGERSKTIVTVTSCRSDGYYNQKAPGSTSKLPRKAPTNLKLFHELAVGIKDAYAAVGQTPIKPNLETDEQTGHPTMSEKEFHARSVLWEFIGNIDFVSALKASGMCCICCADSLFSLLAFQCSVARPSGRSSCRYGDTRSAQRRYDL